MILALGPAVGCAPSPTSIAPSPRVERGTEVHAEVDIHRPMPEPDDPVVEPDEPIDTAPPVDTAPEEVWEPPNILVLVADDVGVDRIGAYGVGDHLSPTPAIDQLAADGVRFSRAWAMPSCSPSRATWLTGRHAFRTGIGKASRVSDGVPLLYDEVTIAEALKWLGPVPYSTAAVGKWHVSNRAIGDSSHVLGQGFDHYRGNLGNLLKSAAQDGGYQGFYNYEYFVDGVRERRTTYLTTQEADDTIHFVNTLPEPWFIHVGFHASHTPIHIPPEDLYTGDTLVSGASDAARFNAMTEAMDTEIGRILEHIDDNTVVVFLGDNGTAKGGAQGPYPKDEVKLSMYEGGIRVPLIIQAPHGARDAVSDALVHTVDLFATLAELGGVVDLSRLALPVDGHSFAGHVEVPDAPPIRDLVYTERFLPNGFGPYTEHYRAVRNEQYKLMWTQGGDYQLFDLGMDWREGDDLLLRDTLTTDELVAFDQLVLALDSARFKR